MSTLEELEAQMPQHQAVDLIFTGSTREYFRIWVVNVLLSVLTLGIYSAWAKVRNKRYFYGNTLLDDAPFDYHAKPIQILKGRIIAVVVLLLFVLVSALNPLLAGVLPLLLALVMPLMVRQGLRFNMAMSSYRGIRFSFRGSRSGAYVAYLLWPALAVMTAYLLWPFSHKRASEYRVSNMWFGATTFETQLKGRAFYAAYLWAILAALGVALVIGLIGAVFVPFLESALEPIKDMDNAQSQLGVLALLVQLAGYALLMLVALAFRAVINARTINHIYGASTLASRVSFQSDLGPWRLTWIYLSNLFAILLTVGLATPWARVRLMRYRVEKTQVFAHASLDEFAAAERQHQSALGEELTDVFDADIGGL